MGGVRAMTQVLTKYIGWVKCEEASFVEFPAGLPGFATERDFVLIRNEAHAPLVFLQSLSTPELCFLAVPVAEVETGYELELGEEDAAVLGVEGPAGEDLEVLVLISRREGEPATANLRAPVVVHASRRKAVQAVRGDRRYSARHVLGGPVPAPWWAPGPRNMMIIPRREGESILLGGEVEVEILECGQGQVKLGIRAPWGFFVFREEIWEAHEENRAAAEGIAEEALPGLIRVLV
jgi:flagellar assembly factor FliW